MARGGKGMKMRFPIYWPAVSEIFLLSCFRHLLYGRLVSFIRPLGRMEGSAGVAPFRRRWSLLWLHVSHHQGCRNLQTKLSKRQGDQPTLLAKQINRKHTAKKATKNHRTILYHIMNLCRGKKGRTQHYLCPQNIRWSRHPETDKAIKKKKKIPPMWHLMPPTWPSMHSTWRLALLNIMNAIKSYQNVNKYHLSAIKFHQNIIKDHQGISIV